MPSEKMIKHRIYSKPLSFFPDEVLVKAIASALEDLKKIDYTDEAEVRNVFNSMEQYATSEEDTHCRLYNLTDSDKKVHVYSDNYYDGDDSYRVKFVQIIDISELFDKQDREYVYNYKEE